MQREGDLLIGARQGSSIATQIERSTRCVVLEKPASRSADHGGATGPAQAAVPAGGALQDADLGPRA
jgi:hypothetical protein